MTMNMRIGQYLLSVSIHVNGEFRLQRGGCKGAEYYATLEDVISRVQPFVGQPQGAALTIYFSRGDKKGDFYLPSREELDRWAIAFGGLDLRRLSFDIANQDVLGASIPSFYYQRDLADIGFRPIGNATLTRVIPFEQSVGFDSFAHNSLYSDSSTNL